MTVITERVYELVVKHLEGTINGKEQLELEQWINQSPINRSAIEVFLQEQTLNQGISNMYKWRTRVWHRLQNMIEEEKVVTMYRRSWWKFGAAAAIFLLIGTGIYFAFFKSKHTASTPVSIANDVQAPKTTRAAITLADGSKIYLDSAGNGTLAMQGDVKVEKTGEGQIIYNGSATEVKYNTLSNPRGSKVVSITLNDGTKVWLNSESSLRYPTAFVGSTRAVEITGEAYFEVKHDASKPFHVKNGGTDVTVLGTHFNVNAYEDEGDLKVTLLQGSVRVASGTQSVLIRPGEQAIVQNKSKLAVDNSADLDQVMAWKNGRFEFSNSTVESVMNQVARWYDVDVEYVGEKPDIHFMGGISRLENVSEVLKMLEQTKAINFRMEGRKIQIMK